MLAGVPKWQSWDLRDAVTIVNLRTGNKVPPPFFLALLQLQTVAKRGSVDQTFVSLVQHKFLSAHGETPVQEWRDEAGIFMIPVSSSQFRAQVPIHAWRGATYLPLAGITFGTLTIITGRQTAVIE